MELFDHTPFATLAFESIAPEGDALQTVIIRGTFEIVAGEVLKPIPVQQPVVAADEYFGKPAESSIRQANDLAPYKPNADILVNATAYAPQGKPCPKWTVEFQIGSLSKRLSVTGPRFWRHRLIHGWQLTEPDPCASVPIRYEHSFGGQWKHKDESGVCEQNPVGVGFLNKRRTDTTQPLPAPRILGFGEEPPPFGNNARPEGLAALAPAWLPRRAFAGTYDDIWTKTRAPSLPKDFKYDFYNAAHPDLIYDGFLKGGEKVLLRGMTPEGELHFTLPTYQFAIVVTDRGDYQYAAVAELDTLHLEVDDRKAFLVWRAGAPLFEDGVKRIEIKMRNVPQPV